VERPAAPSAPSLPAALSSAGDQPRLLYLDPRRLEPNADNVRRDSGDLETLAESLRRYGVLQPLGVVPSEGGFRVVYGNRRREAAILAGLAVVPCVPVGAAASRDRLVTQLLENLQRRDLNDLEKAEGLARLRRQLAAELGPEARAEELDARTGELVGMAPRTVRRYLALRELPPAVRDLLADEKLTVTQAQHLAQLPSPPLQEAVASRAAAEEWTAAQVSRVCAALARAPGLSLEQALAIAGDGWQAVERVGPPSQPTGASEPPARPRRPPAADHAGEREVDADDDLWLEDATGAPTPESLGAHGNPAPFPAHPSTGPADAFAEPQTADGHRVFRIRTLAAFCDEVDRLARCIQEGDLARAIKGDDSAPVRLRLAARQLAFTLHAVEALAGS